MDIAYLKRTAIGFLSVLLVIAVFVYVIFHLTGGLRTEISTTPAMKGSYVVQDTADGYIFRHEKPVSSEYSGTVNYNVSDGEKVKQGELAATVYESGGEEELTARMVVLDREIELLERSNISDNVLVSGTNGIDESIAGYMEAFRTGKREGDLSAMDRLTDELRVLLNRRELIVSSRTSFDEEIRELKGQRAELASRLSGKNEPLYAAESGYFYYNCDGYENIFDPAELSEITPERFDYLAASKPEQKSYAGKYVSVQKWYLALKLDRTELGKYKQDYMYHVAFMEYPDLRIKMKLERMSVSSSEGVLVFSSNEMPSDFGFERMQSVALITEEHEGLRFPASALRKTEDGVDGVYVLYGNTVFFRVVEVYGKEGGYAYVSSDTESYVVSEGDETGEGRVVWRSVSLYDEVIVAGTGLYHGLIVN